MKALSGFRVLVFLSTFLCARLMLAQAAGLYGAVDPFIGTANRGNTFPGAALPFGMVQWSPDTGVSGFYDHADKKIYGFSLTHLSGVGCPVMADFPVLPWTGEFNVSPAKDRHMYAIRFDHGQEQAQPGYYAVTLSDGVKVELAAGDRSGIARFLFPEGKPARLLVNTGGSADSDVHMPFLPPAGREKDGSRVELSSEDVLTGTVTAGGFCGSATRYTVYVAARFDRAFKNVATWQEGVIAKGKRKAEGKHTGAWLDFGGAREVRMKVGLSYVSEKNALDNLDKEITDWDFDRQRARARKRWTRLLDRVEVAGGTPEQRTIFATGLYHMLLHPNLFSDANGEYIGFDWKQHTVKPGQQAQYANFSDWDTYRNTVQLQALLASRRVSDMMQSLVNDAGESGWFPRWPLANEATYVMGGDSPVAVISSAYAFGARDFDTTTALQYMIKAGSVSDRELSYGHRYNQTTERPYLNAYLQYGYVPSDDPIGVSRTLEYAAADFSIAQFAKALGDTANYQRFLKQAQGWRNLLDPETRWLRPRSADGQWLPGFDPERSLPHPKTSSVPTDQYGFEEGNTYQYTFMVPFDYPELFRRIGGDAEAARRLDKFFVKLLCEGEPCFNMGNEPDFGTPYAYVFAGMPWKTQEVVSRIEKETFKTTPDGLAGNDDLGASSGVYVWNALGLYPAVPGVGGVVLGAPLFPQAAIHFEDGRTLKIRGEGKGAYVEEVTLNGAAYASSWLPLSALGKGASELVFTLSDEPNRERGGSTEDRPPSFVQEPEDGTAAALSSLPASGERKQ
ncbi:MAG: GH92 family glycosyl hydrolase [Acidobacteriaceae bacterium]|nr:GH92 family glycosyl hydrolase [Acidobacteriaceae bacterium]